MIFGLRVDLSRAPPVPERLARLLTLVLQDTAELDVEPIFVVSADMKTALTAGGEIWPAPLVTPAHFRGFPQRTEVECTHCFTCRMICPAPGAIEVLRREGTWGPEIYRGHCIRCGLCAVRCPTDAMTMERFTITEHAVPAHAQPGDAAAPVQVDTP